MLVRWCCWWLALVCVTLSPTWRLVDSSKRPKPFYTRIPVEMCMSIDDYFTELGHRWVFFTQSCNATWMQVERLEDQSFLFMISMDGWRNRNNSAFLQVNEKMISANLPFPATHYMRLVIRLDECTETGADILVQANSNEHTVSVDSDGVGEQLLEHVSLSNAKMQLMVTYGECSVQNSYVMMCARNRHSWCGIAIPDRQRQPYVVGCSCFDNQLSALIYALLGLVIIVLICITLMEVKKPVLPRMHLRNEESVSVIAYSKQKAYHYQVVFRVGCPTLNFDLTNTRIDFELLNARFEMVGEKVRFGASELGNPTLSSFICQLYVLRPIPRIKAVRVSHSCGRRKSGIFLFDVFIKFLSGPVATDEQDSDDEDEIYQSDTAVRPLKYNPGSIHNQHIRILAYIIEVPSVYLAVRSKAPLHFPTTAIAGHVSVTFGKILLWFSIVQLFAWVIYFQGRWNKKRPALLISIGIIIVVSALLLAQLAILLHLYSWLSRQSTVEQIEVGSALKRDRTSGRFQGRNCYYAAQRLLAIVLIAMLPLFGWIIWRNIDQNLEPTLFIEAIALNVVIIVGYVVWIASDTLNYWSLYNATRESEEDRLRASSKRRAVHLMNNKTSVSLSQLSPAQLFLEQRNRSPEPMFPRRSPSPSASRRYTSRSRARREKSKSKSRSESNTSRLASLPSSSRSSLTSRVDMPVRSEKPGD